MTKIGLALGGGGAKGFTHIGVLKILDDLKVRPDAVSGCSMGAIVGALYCLGYSGKQIEKKADEITIKKLLKMLIDHRTKNSHIEEFLDKLFEGKTFEDLRTPLFINATDLNTGQEIVFNSGNIAKAVRASISIPFIFKPVIINGRVLVDGGVTNNVPISILKDKGMTKILAVSTNTSIGEKLTIETVEEHKKGSKSPKLIKVLAKSISIIQSNASIIKNYEKEATLLITPNLTDFNLMDFKRKKQIIKAGEKEAQNKKRKIREVFKSQLKSKTFKEFLKKSFEITDSD